MIETSPISKRDMKFAKEIKTPKIETHKTKHKEEKKDENKN
jgi:hypothetical protein